MDLIQPLLAVALVLSLLWATIRFLRGRRAGVRLVPQGLVSRAFKQNANRLHRSGTLTLTGHHSLHLVRIGERDLLLAAHPAGLSLIGQWTDGGLEHIVPEAAGAATFL